MFGKLLGEIMTKKRIKVKELSILSDITEGYLSDIKRGKALPRPSKLNSILDNINLSNEEREELLSAWEKDSSPAEFVKKYEVLEKKVKKYEKLLENVPENELLEEISKQKSIIQKLEKDRAENLIYKELFDMMSEEDKNYTIKNILRTIEAEMREQGIFLENKKIIEKIKKDISKIFSL